MVAKVLRFELPFAADAPQLVRADGSIRRVAVRSSGSYTMDVTLIDTPDHRLLRAGVVLAHRISDGAGEWYLAAPQWHGLPDEVAEPIGATAELPNSYAALIRPIRRQGLLGPVAGLTCDRTEYVLRGASDETLGVIRDERVTIRRGRQVANRYREVTLTPSQAMTREQADEVAEAMLRASATVVDGFPTLQQRLGAPATGPTDFPDPQPLRQGMSLDEYVQRRFACRLRDVVVADLDLLAGRASARGLVAALTRTGRDIRGLAAVLEPAWREHMEAELDVLKHIDPDSTTRPLQGNELLGVIDALASAARAPRLGDLSQRPAGPVFVERVKAGTMILVDRCRSLTVDAPDGRWVSALLAAEQLQLTAEVGAPLAGKTAKRFLKRLGALIGELRPAVAVVSEPTDAQLDAMTARAAYAEGRGFAERIAAVERARAQFVADWPGQVKRLGKLVRQA